MGVDRSAGLGRPNVTQSFTLARLSRGRVRFALGGFAIEWYDQKKSTRRIERAMATKKMTMEECSMNVYDRAYELAKALRQSREVAELREARLAVEAQSEAKQLLSELRSRQEAVQQRMMAGEEPSEQELNLMEERYETVSRNPLIEQLFEAERRFAAVFDEVNKIVNDALKDIYE